MRNDPFAHVYARIAETVQRSFPHDDVTAAMVERVLTEPESYNWGPLTDAIRAEAREYDLPRRS